MGDWHTHVFTSTYASDVSGVCSMLYELGGMSVLHDPSGCNSTYTTHDEPRWYDTDSLMFLSGLDEMHAVFGDDSKLIEDTIAAVNQLHPRFITLCGASIPHIIGFDYGGVAKIIEDKTNIPVLPVATDGLRSYVSGCDLASIAWLQRFAIKESEKQGINLLGVTPIDFGNLSVVKDMETTLTKMGFEIHCTFAYGNTFEQLQHIPEAAGNLVVSSAARKTAKYLKRKYNMPYVEGIPVGPYMQQQIKDAFQQSRLKAYSEEDGSDIVVIGEEIYARSMACEITHTTKYQACALFPDVNEGIDEDVLVEKCRKAKVVVADPLFANCMDQEKLIPIPHVGYSGRIYQNQNVSFTKDTFSIKELIERKTK